MNSIPFASATEKNEKAKASMIRTKTFYFKPRKNDVINFVYKMEMKNGSMSSRGSLTKDRTKRAQEKDFESKKKKKNDQNVNETSMTIFKERKEDLKIINGNESSTVDVDNLEMESNFKSTTKGQIESVSTPSPPKKQRSYSSMGDSKIIIRDIFSRILSPIPEESTTRDITWFLEDFCEGIPPPPSDTESDVDEPVTEKSAKTLKPITKIPKNFLLIDDEILNFLKGTSSPLYDQIISRSLEIQKLINEKRSKVEVVTESQTLASTVGSNKGAKQEVDIKRLTSSPAMKIIKINEDFAGNEKTEKPLKIIGKDDEVLSNSNPNLNRKHEKSSLPPLILGSKSYKRARNSSSKNEK